MSAAPSVQPPDSAARAPTGDSSNSLNTPRTYSPKSLINSNQSLTTSSVAFNILFSCIISLSSSAKASSVARASAREFAKLDSAISRTCSQTSTALAMRHRNTRGGPKLPQRMPPHSLTCRSPPQGTQLSRPGELRWRRRRKHQHLQPVWKGCHEIGKLRNRSVSLVDTCLRLYWALLNLGCILRRVCE